MSSQQLDLFQAAQFASTSIQHSKSILTSPVEKTPIQVSEFRQRVTTALGSDYRVLLSVHDNRSTMISFRRNRQLVKLRTHHMFLDAPDGIICAIADYVTKGVCEAGQLLDAYIANHQARIRTLPYKPVPLLTCGRYFDLQILFDELNRLYFQNAICARIGWGRHRRRRLQKFIRLGVYDHRAREIRVHPVLDCVDVPRFFIEYIVFHEMLHQLFPCDAHVGRHAHHPRAFRCRERSFPHYAAALEWEKKHLQKLLTKQIAALRWNLR